VGAAAGAAGNNRVGNSTGGSWGAYYWNGMIYSSEIDRGFDIMELQPTENLSKNEIEAAKLINLKEYNPQSQPKIEWPGAFPVVRSYVDQLERGKGIAQARVTAVNAAVDAAEKQSGSARRNALNALAKEVDGDAGGAKDSARVKMLAEAIRKLASATR